MTLEKTERVNLLADIYAPLLNERQQELLQFYFSEDYSLAEIAEIYQISRQAVHDGLQRAMQSLETYEEKLHLLEQRQQVDDLITALDELLPDIPDSSQVAIVRKLMNTIKR